MDGVSRAAGVGPTIQLGGKTLTVSGKILEHYALFEAEVLRQRDDPVSLAMKGIAAGQQVAAERAAQMDAKERTTFLAAFREINEQSNRRLLEIAYDKAKQWRFVAPEEIQQWLNTFAGTCFCLWLAVRHNGDEYTLENVTKLLLQRFAHESQAEVITQVQSAIDQASGEDYRGNSTGPASTGPNPDDSPGAPTTAS